MDEKERETMPGTLPGVELQESSNRRMLLAMGGFFLLGIALVLLLFSGPLLDGFKAETPANLPQIPAAVENLKDGNPAVNALVTGDQAAEFTLSDLEGNNVSLSDFVGQPLMVNFWATWCAPCRLEMPELQKSQEIHRDEGLVVLAVNAQEDPQQVREFIDELGLTFTPLLDRDGAVGRAYGVLGLPSTYFVEPSGVVSAVHRGILSEKQIETYLAQILP